MIRTVWSDPPWRPTLHANTKGRFGGGPYRVGPQGRYKTMTLDEIIANPPAVDVDRKAHLWIWVINPHLDWGLIVGRAWGFKEHVTTVTWCKPGLGTGQFMSNTEHVLLMRRGGPAGNAFGRMRGTHYPWPHPRPRVHSRKPDGAYQLCERVSPGPRLEMYARYRREGWQQMGDQLEAA